MTPERMTPELKDKWLFALRSGKYTQGYDTMNKDGKMCCLGVLCDVVGFTWELVEDLDSEDPDSEYSTFKCEAGIKTLEPKSRYQLGLSDELHELCYNLNDGPSPVMLSKYKHLNIEPRSYSFTEIADFLEDKL